MSSVVYVHDMVGRLLYPKHCCSVQLYSLVPSLISPGFYRLQYERKRDCILASFAGLSPPPPPPPPPSFLQAIKAWGDKPGITKEFWQTIDYSNYHWAVALVQNPAGQTSLGQCSPVVRRELYQTPPPELAGLWPHHHWSPGRTQDGHPLHETRLEGSHIRLHRQKHESRVC